MVQGAGCRVQGAGCRVQGAGCMVHGAWCRVRLSTFHLPSSICHLPFAMPLRLLEIIAIVIGAMVIAPLLGPNIGLSLASTLGDLDLAKRSLRAIGAGVFTAAAVSLLLGVALTVDPAGPEIAGRTHAGLGDIALALAAGAAGSLAFTSGVPAIVVGVMVAVALLPPLVVAGLLAGSGHGKLAFGAFILLLTNVTCINLAAVGTFLIQKVRPRTWWEADRARKATWIAAGTWIIMLGIMVSLILAGLVETN